MNARLLLRSWMGLGLPKWHTFPIPQPSCPPTYLFPAGHRAELDDPVLELLLTNDGHQWDACLLTVLQLVQ